jgi:hypothetical protein
MPREVVHLLVKYQDPFPELETIPEHQEVVAERSAVWVESSESRSALRRSSGCWSRSMAAFRRTSTSLHATTGVADPFTEVASQVCCEMGRPQRSGG